jgi:acyl transferase domain-containing protein
MRKGRDEEQVVLACLAAMHTAGVPVGWDAFFAPAGARRVGLPTYAFQRERLWLDQVVGSMDVSRAGLGAIDHPLLGAMLALPHDGGAVFSGRVALATHPWLRDHAVAGAVLLPGTAFVELALAVADQLGASGVEELTLAAPLLLGEQDPVCLQVHVTAADPAGRRAIEIRSCRDDDWTQHASGLLAADDAELAEPSIAASWPPAGAEAVDVDLFYDNLADAGYEYGPAFQNVRRVYRAGEAWFAELTLSDAERSDAARFRLHPALADAALQVSLLAAPDEAATVVPFSFTGVRTRGEGAVSLRVKVEAKAAAGEAVTVALTGADASGATAFVIDAVQARPADLEALRARPREEADDLLAVRWAPARGRRHHRAGRHHAGRGALGGDGP